MKIQIKNFITGEVIFELEKDNNSVKETVLEAIKSKADLNGANLTGADLRRADLRRADLNGANLTGAYLTGAYLTGANLTGAYLRGADLNGANLTGAYLRGADLNGADLSGADLNGADLSGADLSGATDLEYIIASTRILPEGDLIGYKKCKDGVVVKLLIPKEAKRSSAFGRKCRAEYAEVLEIYGATKAYSSYDEFFKYEVGKTVKPTKPFSDDWQNECAPGIHFFITKTEAENYVI